MGWSGSIVAAAPFIASCDLRSAAPSSKFDKERALTKSYSWSDKTIDRIAFPLGGIGAGMFCLNGNGSFSHFSLYHKPDVYNKPNFFGAIAIKGKSNGTKILEGPLPRFEIFGNPGSGSGNFGSYKGLPRFEKATFEGRFPFASTTLDDDDIPLKVKVTAWSPFIPNDEDHSSLPLAGIEYTFENDTHKTIEALFSMNTENFLRQKLPGSWENYHEGSKIESSDQGFTLKQAGLEEHPEYEAAFSIACDEEDLVVDHAWFRGGWFDALTVLWKNFQNFSWKLNGETKNSIGASLYVPFKLKPGEKKIIKLRTAWYVPASVIQHGSVDETKSCDPSSGCCSSGEYYQPWYSSEYNSIEELANYWKKNYKSLRQRSQLFSDAFFDTTLPDEVVDAVSANLSILKSPTVLRLANGCLWGYEGCHDSGKGCCEGSCTHVWNYAQALPHLFPSLERSLRETEFFVNQDDQGHQVFRSTLPVKLPVHDFYAAADGQMGGIIKAYREWRISGDKDWLIKIWPKVKESMVYCTNTWDPDQKGVIEEPHHNTYDIEFWGPDGMHNTIYLASLLASIEMGQFLKDDVSQFARLAKMCRAFLEDELFNGEYFIQIIKTEGLKSPPPLEMAAKGYRLNYSEEALNLLKTEGPKYQYGDGCLSDGIVGACFAQMAGLGEIMNTEKTISHLRSTHRFNFRKDLSDHANPQRPTFAIGHEAGLLLCSWPKGTKLTLPFVYSNEVWTGIEYQLASHLFCEGLVDEGLEIVSGVRARYNGMIRNPYNEYECGHWYARAMSSYGLLFGLTGLRYDAVEKTLYIDSKIGDSFKSFISTASGFGSAGLSNGSPFLNIAEGNILVEKCVVSGVENEIQISRI